MKEGDITLQFKVNELKKSMYYHSKDLEDKVNEYDRKIDNVANSEVVQYVAAQAKELKEKLVRLEDRTRRNNLRFDGFSESGKESWDE